MPEGMDSLGGRKLARIVVRDRILDEASGHEFHTGKAIEAAFDFDGTEEQVESHDRQLLCCGHVHQVGGYVARCDTCSQKAGHPVYVCGLCAVICPVTGETLCLRCSKIGPDRERYSPEGLKEAQKMGLFDRFRSDLPSSGSTNPISRIVQGILEWW